MYGADFLPKGVAFDADCQDGLLGAWREPHPQLWEVKRSTSRSGRGARRSVRGAVEIENRLQFRDLAAYEGRAFITAEGERIGRRPCPR